MAWLLYAVLFSGGYAASIYTWPWVRKVISGAQAEADRLREKARDIEASVRGKL